AVDHSTIDCTACSGSTLRYASALPARAENAKPAMLDTRAARRTTAAVILAIPEPWRCSTIALPMSHKPTSAHAPSATSADRLKVGLSRQRPTAAILARTAAPACAAGLGTGRAQPSPRNGMAREAATAPTRSLCVMAMTLDDVY